MHASFDMPSSPMPSFVANPSPFVDAPMMPSQGMRREEGRRPLAMMMACPQPMVARSSYMIERKKKERRESFASYLDDNWEDLDNERLSELNTRLVKMKDQRAVLDRQIQALEVYMGEIWEDAERRIESEEM